MQLIYQPDACSIAFTSDTIEIYEINDKLKKHGWKLFSLQFPAGLMFVVTLMHTTNNIAGRFISDLREIVAEMDADLEARKAKGEVIAAVGAGGSSIYGSQQRISDRSILADVAGRFIDNYYETRHPVKPFEALPHPKPQQ
jgi:sphinganine-1-phosphate aldolase